MASTCKHNKEKIELLVLIKDFKEFLFSSCHKLDSNEKCMVSKLIRVRTIKRITTECY